MDQRSHNHVLIGTVCLGTCSGLKRVFETVHL
jgi:hypothetical protein